MAEGRLEVADTKQPYIDSFSAVNNTNATRRATVLVRPKRGCELRVASARQSIALWRGLLRESARSRPVPAGTSLEHVGRSAIITDAAGLGIGRGVLLLAVCGVDRRGTPSTRKAGGRRQVRGRAALASVAALALFGAVSASACRCAR